MTNLDSILKSRDITLPTKVCLVKAMGWPVVFQWSCMDVRVRRWRKLSTEKLMFLNCGIGEDSWESLGQQGDPSNQSILKKIGLGCSLKGLVLKLKLQYFGHLIRRVDSFEKTLMLGRHLGQEKGMTEDEMVGWHYWLNGHEFEQTLGNAERQGSLMYCSPWRCNESDTTEQLNKK